MKMRDAYTYIGTPLPTETMRVRVCPNAECGHTNQPNATSCARCGEGLPRVLVHPRVRVCPDSTCGHQNQPNAKKCGRCGKALVDNRTLEQVWGPPYPGNSHYVAYAVWVFLLFVCILLSVFV